MHYYAQVPIEKLGFGFGKGFSIRMAKDGNGVVAEVNGEEYPITENKEINNPKKVIKNYYFKH